jgi:hypothetical protein
MLSIVFTCSYCEQHALFQPVFLDQTTLPEKFTVQKGKIIEGLIWNDKTGKNVIVITKYSKGVILKPGYAD